MCWFFCLNFVSFEVMKIYKKIRRGVLIILPFLVLSGGVVFLAFGEGLPLYYRDVEVLKNKSIVGKGPLTEAERLMEDHYFLFKYDDQGRRESVQYFENGLVTKAPYLGVAQIVSVYEEGEEFRSYQNKDGERVFNEDGVYAVYLVLGESGEPVSAINYDVQDRPMKDTHGVVGYQWNISASGQVAGMAYLDEQRAPVLNDHGVGSVEFEYDDAGREISRSYYDAFGQLSEKKFLGCAVVRFKYEAQNLVEKSCYGKDESLKRSPQWRGVAMVRYEYDTNGNKTKESFYDVDAQLVLPRYGEQAAFIEFQYDAVGNMVEKRFYGKDEQLVALKDGGAIRQWRYDAFGRNIEASFLGAEEVLVALPTGEAIRRWQYDDQGRVVEKSFYGVDGHLIDTIRDGVALVRYQYDGEGHRIEEAFFDAEERPAVSRQWGVAIRRWVFDEFGQLMEMRSHGVDGQLVLDANLGGAAIKRFEYDAEGQKVRTVLLGGDEGVITGY